MAAREPMVHLYYSSKPACRQDCDTLGIDRRRVISLRRGHQVMCGLDVSGQPIFKRVVAAIRARQSLVMEHLEQLQHDDDETWS